MDSITKCRENLTQYMDVLQDTVYFNYLDKQIPYENLTNSLKLFFCFTLAHYENIFHRPGDNRPPPISLSRTIIGDSLIEIFLQNKINILTIFANQIALDNNLKLNIDSFQDYLSNLIKNSFEKNIEECEKKVPKELFTELLKYIFDSGDTPGKILEQIQIRSTKIEGGFFIGMVIGEYTLSEKLSENVWKAYRGSRNYAIKTVSFEEYFQLDDKEFKKIYKTIFNPNNAQKLKEYSIQYKNQSYTQSIKKNIAPLLDVIFSITDRKICEIKPFYDITISNMEKQEINNIIDYLIDFCENLHKSKCIFNNLSPEKIAVEIIKDSKGIQSYNFVLLDLKCMTPIFSRVNYIQNTGYESLNILTRNFICNVYDDIESIFYVINYIIHGVDQVFENEAQEKEHLDFCTPKIKEAILSLRQLRFLDKIDQNPSVLKTEIKMQNSDYIFAENTDDVDFRDTDSLIFGTLKISEEKKIDDDTYLKQLYENRRYLSPDIYYQNDQLCIIKIFYSIMQLSNDAIKRPIYGTKLQEEIYARIFDQERSNSNLKSDELSLLCAQKMFEFLYGVSYN